MPVKTLASPDMLQRAASGSLSFDLCTPLRRYDNDPDGCVGSAPLI
jgi:hypothetical protein